ARRLATTTALACAVWAGAVGTAVATTEAGPGLMHAIGQDLDLDDMGHAHHAGHPPHGGYTKGRHA
ncbi:UDP-N-acetylglucosamine--N-acetylglucosamine transferase, partial [Streptomyces prunicolor]|nr:UDP-N-acetylglucosamine--N-acetylglucosamine transferase [Streptomyces prunicolor]